MNKPSWVVTCAGLLLIGVDPVLLRGDEVEEGFGTAIELVQFAVLLLVLLLGTALVEDGEQERTVMERAVFDGVVQFGDLTSTDVSQIMKDHV